MAPTGTSWRRRLRRAWIALAPRSFARCCAPDDEELGRLGEQLAARELRRRGWRIVGQRTRTAFVEVDLVAREGRTWVLVEVKSGREEHVPLPRGTSAPPRRWRPGQRFDRRRSARLRALARQLARSSGRAVRIDLIEVFLDARSGGVRLEHRRGIEGPLE